MLGRMSEMVKGFGCRPVVTYPPMPRAGVRKPPRKEPAGARRWSCRLWGFERAEALARDALVCTVENGLPSAAQNWSPLTSSGV